MRIRNGHPCTCESVPLESLVPACPGCHQPLIASSNDDTYGWCLYRADGGRCTYDLNMVPPDEFLWLERDLFNSDDIPPGNGRRPIDVRKAEAWLKTRN